jgi:protein-S-isoprenylcysteine O-methyltransferase Ste14
MSRWAAIARRIRVPLGFAFAAFYFWLARPRPSSLAIGIAVASLGLYIRAVASGHVTKNEMVTATGPYAYVRNPLYLGSLVTALGFAIAARNPWVVVVTAAIFLVVYVPVILSEEAFLAQRFPEFQEYANHVPRLLPRRSRFGESHGVFSWDLYCKHREYNAVLGAVLLIAALAAKMIWFT